jgi:cytoskeletal protein CcmA (bactofilin family)
MSGGSETLGTSPSPPGPAPPAMPMTPPVASIPAALPTPIAVDLRDSGVAVHDSVRAREWSASGGARVLGSVEVDRAVLLGNVSIGGSIAADRFESSGFLAVFGPARIRSRIQLGGESRWSAVVETSELEVAGRMVVSGPLQVGGLAHVRGTLEVSGAARAGRLVVDGTITVAGLLEAQEVALHLHRASRVQAIRADVVRVTRRKSLPIPGAAHPTLTVERIDAREVELEGVSCEYLKAERIALGPQCHITRLEGSVVARHPSARVGPESRSAPPHGLSR